MLKTFNVGIKGIIVSDGKALILRSSDGTERWDVPGGRINDNEDIEEALTRELHEEIPSIGNFKIKNLLNAFRLDHDLSNGNGLVLIYYKVTADKFEVELSDEHDNYTWVNLDEVDGYKLEQGYKDAIKFALTQISPSL